MAMIEQIRRRTKGRGSGLVAALAVGLLAGMLVVVLGPSQAGSAETPPTDGPLSLSTNSAQVREPFAITWAGGEPCAVEFLWNDATVLAGPIDGSVATTVDAAVPTDASYFHDNPPTDHVSARCTSGEVLASIPFLVEWPTISVSPATAHRGDPVTITMRGFKSGCTDPLRFVLGDRELASVAGSPADGETVDFTVPTDLTHGGTITAVDCQPGYGFFDPSAPFDVDAPSIEIPRLGGIPGSSFTFTTNGFDPACAEPLTFRLGSTTVVTASEAPEDGTVYRVTVPIDAPIGPSALSTEDCLGPIQAAFEVFTPATLVATPTHGEPGASIALAGTGFDACNIVRLYWDRDLVGPDGEVTPIAETDPADDGTIHTELTIPVGAVVRSHPVTADCVLAGPESPDLGGTYALAETHVDVDEWTGTTTSGPPSSTTTTVAITTTTTTTGPGPTVSTPPTTTAPAAPNVPAVRDTLFANETLHAGEQLTSLAGGYVALMQGDGNFVAIAPGNHALWATATDHHPGAYIVMQDDGNLVVYETTGPTTRRALWASGTDGCAGAYLTIQSDGNLVMYQRVGNTVRSVWSRYDGRQVTCKAPPRDHLYPGETLHAGEYLWTDNGYQLLMQPDSNLVMYGPSGALWASNTVGRAGAYVTMQPDGNLVIYRPTGPSTREALYDTSTWGCANSYLQIQPDGNLVVYQRLTGEAPRAIWARRTGPLVSCHPAPSASPPRPAAGPIYIPGSVTCASYGWHALDMRPGALPTHGTPISKVDAIEVDCGNGTRRASNRLLTYTVNLATGQKKRDKHGQVIGGNDVVQRTACGDRLRPWTCLAPGIADQVVGDVAGLAHDSEVVVLTQEARPMVVDEIAVKLSAKLHTTIYTLFAAPSGLDSYSRGTPECRGLADTATHNQCSYGIAILSTLPLSNQRGIRFDHPAERRAMVSASVTINGRNVTIGTIHGQCCDHPDDRSDEIQTFRGTLVGPIAPTIIGGDWNSDLNSSSVRQMFESINQLGFTEVASIDNTSGESARYDYFVASNLLATTDLGGNRTGPLTLGGYIFDHKRVAVRWTIPA